MRNVSIAVWALALGAGFGVLAPSRAEAQVATAAQPTDAAVEARLGRFNQFLNLSPEQQAQVRPILEAESRKLGDLAGRDGSSEQKVQALQAIGNETDRRVKEVLTPEQLKQFSQSRSLLRPQLPAAALGM